MTDKIRIHLADDHKVLIDGMKTLLNTIPNFEMVGFSLDGNTIFDEVTKNKADVLVLDINMPEKDGIEVIKEFAEKGFPCKVIVLSSYEDLTIIKEVMSYGVSSYLSKKCAGDNIVEAINAVTHGQDYFCETIREKIYNTSTKEIIRINKFDSKTKSILTPRELEVVSLISLEYSGREISNLLFISTNTVETHRKNIMRKLEIKNIIGLVKYALKNNLIKP
jgi:DNA-binding NarL/FixJ family response regulator